MIGTYLSQLVGGALQERELLYMFYIEICSTDVKIK
jgi:hypothetical protein